jgi:hypothetical protein
MFLFDIPPPPPSAPVAGVAGLVLLAIFVLMLVAVLMIGFVFLLKFLQRRKAGARLVSRGVVQASSPNQ